MVYLSAIKRENKGHLEKELLSYSLFLLVHCLFTGRNEVVAKVIFLHLSVILFTGGGSASVHAGIPPGPDPPSGTPPSTPPSGTPSPESRPRHTVNERPVRILLECILV